MNIAELKQRGREIMARVEELDGMEPQSWDDLIGAMDMTIAAFSDMRLLAVQAKASGVDLVEFMK